MGWEILLQCTIGVNLLTAWLQNDKSFYLLFMPCHILLHHFNFFMGVHWRFSWLCHWDLISSDSHYLELFQFYIYWSAVSWKIWERLRYCEKKKDEICLSLMTKARTPIGKYKKQRDNKNATKNFDNATIADRLRTFSWRSNSSPTLEFKPI